MEIQYYGLGCFRLSESGLPPVLMDPYDEEETGLALPDARAGIVTSSRLMVEPESVKWPNLRGVIRTLSGPGEYEIGGVFITGVASARREPRNGEQAQEGDERFNVIYTVDMQGVTVAHLGQIRGAPKQSQVEAMGRVNVLIVPIGITGGMTPAKASEAVSLVEPDIVIPMHYKIPGLRVPRKPVDAFLKEMGLGKPNPLDRLRLSSSSIPEDLQIVMLEPQGN